jgi:glycolate oxidase iron-sulfur subunit
MRRFVLRNVVARRGALAVAVAPARWYANSLVRKAARRTGFLRGRLRSMEAQLPRRAGKPYRPRKIEGPADGVLFTGCVMGELFGNVHRATERVYRRAGITLAAAPRQGCCGALHAHDGDLDYARKLARKNISALEDTAGPIIVNSAGCGAAMKEYGDLLADDRKWAVRARLFSERVKDASELLGDLPAGKFEAAVTYQDACHLAHAQRIREQPRDLLRRTMGCSLIETTGGDVCCGAAGIYSLVQPEMSAELRNRKAEQFALVKPDVNVTANPGCQMHYEAAVREAGLDARVMHLMELLDEAGGGAAKP